MLQKMFKLIQNIATSNKAVCPMIILTLSIKGVIYAIIHIPSNKIYIGETFQQCYTRFKRHQYDRHLEDGHSLNLYRLMKKQKIHNFMILPHEMIDKTQYYDKNGVPNCHVPLGRSKSFRTARPNRWLQKKDSAFLDQICTSCVEIE